MSATNLATPVQVQPIAIEPPPLQAAAAGESVFWNRFLIVQAILLASLAHVLLAGYQLGVGNQTIQVPFLHYWADKGLYAKDAMVVYTAEAYPSFFFRILSKIAIPFGIERTYLILHLLTSFAVLLGAAWLARSMFQNRGAALVMLAMLFAGHHRALAGDELYSVGFTHTWAVFPLAILALAFFYRDEYLAAFIVAGITFNLHALTAAYLMALFMFWGVLSLRRIGLVQLLLCLAVFGALAMPGAVLMLKASRGQVWDPEWVRLTTIRSADHSIASSWWQAGTPDIPRFLLIFALAALSLSFTMPAQHRRKSILFAAATGIMFLFGFVFGELKPIPIILRAQLFRSSRLLLLLMLAHVAWGIFCAWRLTRGKDDESKLSLPQRWAELASAVVSLLVLTIPQLLPLLPYAVLIATGVALLNARLSWAQGLIAGAAMGVTFAAWKSIDFVIPGLGAGGSVSLTGFLSGVGIPFWIALGAAIGIWAMSKLTLGPSLRWLVVGEGVLVCILLPIVVFRALNEKSTRDKDWIEAQKWASANTNADARFLTPPNSSGFRIHSARSVVGEWRDGTQAYFSADFARTWWEYMEALRPGMMFDKGGEGTKQLSPGKPLEQFTDEELASMAERTHAEYIVLPIGQQKRFLNQVYANERWAIYTPKITTPSNVAEIESYAAQDPFMKQVQANIEKHRKSDVKIELVDAGGRPLTGAEFSVRQTRSSFGFGCSLPFFAEVPRYISAPDYHPEPVTPQELQRFLEVFNYTVIPFSGKWLHVEPVENQRKYEELDKYVEWCHKNNIEMELHYLGGPKRLHPRWLQRYWYDDEGMQKVFTRHAMQMFDRYADRVKYWQVINDAEMHEFAPEVVKLARQKYPNIKLGFSDCTKFYKPSSNWDFEAGDLFKGIDEVEYMKAKGTPLDYFAPHGHSPHGLWADGRVMYECFDEFAKRGVKIHITEEFIPLYQRGVSFANAARYPARIQGPVRKGSWTPELQAEFMEYFFTVAYSHPSVNAVNYWLIGPSDNPGSGLIDEKTFEPKPVFNRLKKLITETWRTKSSGRSAADGSLAFRGFHGDYEIDVKTADGKSAKGTFKVEPATGNTKVRLKVASQDGKIELLK